MIKYRKKFMEVTMDLKGTKTEKNLMEAFAGESQARNKYTYYASKEYISKESNLWLHS